MLAQTDRRLFWKFAYQAGWKGMLAVRRFKKRIRAGRRFPPFVFISLTNDCDLKCQGCWVTRTVPPVQLSPQTFDDIIAQCRKQGSSFFGILGGEPLLYPKLFELLGRHPDCYFQLFTNGTLIDDEAASTMRRLGNISPLVSIEGLEQISDERRGGRSVYSRSMEGLKCCIRNRLITGVATSICRSNFEELVSESFVRQLIDLGVQYLWYYIYRPVGDDPCPDLALSEDKILALRRFVVEIRARVPLIIVDAYWDDKGRAVCPAVMGVSHHISPGGAVEPCPPIQFAVDTVGDGKDLAQIFEESQFLKKFSDRAADLTRGCILLEHPGELKTLIDESGARPTSGRPNADAELQAMKPLPGHHLPGREIPEKSWFYSFAKRNWFFGFGAYG